MSTMRRGTRDRAPAGYGADGGEESALDRWLQPTARPALLPMRIEDGNIGAKVSLSTRGASIASGANHQGINDAGIESARRASNQCAWAPVAIS